MMKKSALIAIVTLGLLARDAHAGGTVITQPVGQQRVTGTCLGQVMVAIAANGTVTCEADDDTGFVTAGTGLTAMGTTVNAIAGSGITVNADDIAIDPTYTQRRVSSSCSAGSSIRAIAQDGTVTCETDDDTTYTAGGGLTLGGGAFSIADADRGDVTISSSGTVFTIDNGVVTLAKQADIATARIVGRVTAGTGSPEALTGTQATTLLDTFSTSGTTKGLVAGSNGATTSFLRGDNTWATPTDTDTLGPDGDKGDITVGGTGTTLTIDNDAVTYAKIQNVSATDRVLCRDTAAAGDIEECTVGGGLEFTGSVGLQRSALTGDVTASAGSNSTTIANNAVSDAKLRDSAALSVIGRSANSSGDPADIAGTDGQVLRVSGTTLGFGSIPETSITGLCTTNNTVGKGDGAGGQSCSTITDNGTTVATTGALTVSGLVTGTAGFTTGNNYTTTGTGDLVSADDLTVGDDATITDTLSVASATTLISKTNDGSADHGRLRMPSNVSSRGDWFFDTSRVTFNGTADPTLVIGYNYDGTGGKPLAAEHSLGWFIEANYDTGPDNYMENYLQYHSADGLTTFRPVFFQIDRADDTLSNAVIMGSTANGLNITDEAGTIAMNIKPAIITTPADYLYSSSSNFNIETTGASGNLYLSSNGGALYLNPGSGDGSVDVCFTTPCTFTVHGAGLFTGNLSTDGNLVAGNATTDSQALWGDTTISEAVGGTFTAASRNLKLYDTTSMAAGVGGAILFTGNVTGTTETSFAYIKAMKTNGTSNHEGGDLVFGTRLDDSGDVTERMRITDAGNVGIGTDTTPDALLQVQAGTTTANAPESGTTLLLRQDNSTNNYLTMQAVGARAGIRFNNTSAAADGFIVYDNTTRALYYGTATTARLYADSNGSLFVGDTAHTGVANNVDILTVGNTGTGQTTSTSLVSLSHSGSFDATGGNRDVIGLNVAMSSTRSAGANLQINYAAVLDSTGAASQNVALLTKSGDVILNNASGSTTIKGATAIGDNAADAHTLTGTLNANSTAGSNGEVLTIVSGVPKWATPSAGSIGGSGTDGRSARFSGSTTILGTGAFTDDGTNASIDGSFTFGNATTDTHTGMGQLTHTETVGATLGGSGANIVVRDDTAQAAGVGGAINLGGKYTNAGLYTTGTEIKAAKQSGTDGEESYFLKFATKESGTMVEYLRLGSGVSWSNATIMDFNGSQLIDINNITTTSFVQVGNDSSDTLTVEGGTTLNNSGGSTTIKGSTTLGTTSSNTLTFHGVAGFNDGPVDINANTTGLGDYLDVTYDETAQTTAVTGVDIVYGGSYNTTSGALAPYGLRSDITSTRSSGANNLTNTAAYFNASGAQINNALVTHDGDVILNDTSGTTTVRGASTFSSTVDVTGALNGWTTLTQAASQDVTNAGVTDSNTFLITTTAGKVYAIDGFISAGGSNATGDYIFDWAVAAGTMDCAGTEQSLTTADAIQNTTIIATAAADTTDTSVGTRADATIGIGIRFNLVCKVSNSTTLKYRFGNAAPSGGRVSRTQAGSYIRYRQLN